MAGQRQKKRPNAGERRAGLVEQEVITAEEATRLSAADEHAIGFPIESPIGVMAIPVGIAEHFIVNDRTIAGIPMATEERSIVAAASKAAKLAEPLGGFAVTVPTHATVRGHVLYSFSSSGVEKVSAELRRHFPEFIEELRKEDPLVKHGGGLLDLSCDVIVRSQRSLIIVRIEINPAEAMGANAVTRIGERLAGLIKKTCRHDAIGTICTNHRSGWEVGVTAQWSCEVLGHTRLRRMLVWDDFAAADVDRVVTNNKGILNGVTAVALATGQDTRAIEACAHALSIVSGRIQPLATYWVDAESGLLHGELHLFLPVATKGGKTNHPQAEIYRKIMGATTAKELACIMAAVGLAQNFGALYCLAGEGIPAAHVALSKA